MAEEADVFDDSRYECFEPRDEGSEELEDENVTFSEVTLKSGGGEPDKVEHIIQALTTITVDVGSPEKHSTFRETYIRFLVNSQSTREEFRNQTSEVFRRYNDFLWLRNRLEETNPTIVIPPFPPKHSINSINRFTGPFIITRCRALHRFINRVCAHPVLSACDDLFNFLTIKDDQTWMDYKRSHAVNGQYWNKVKSLVQIGESSPEFADAIPKLEGCRNACEHIINASAMINEEERQLAREMSTLGAHYSQWSSESGYIPKVGSALYQIGQCSRFCYRREHLSMLDKLKMLVEQHSQAIVPVTQCIQTNLIPEMNDLISYSECVKKVVNRRNLLQGTIRDNIETANELERGMDMPSTLSRKLRRETVDEERSRRESRLSELRSRADSLNKHLSHANTDLRLEYTQWESHRRHTIKLNLVAFAQQRLQHHRRLDEQWIHLLEDLNSGKLGNGLSTM